MFKIPSKLLKRRKELYFRITNAIAINFLENLYKKNAISGSYSISAKGTTFELKNVKYRYLPSEYGCTGNIDFSGYQENDSIDLLISFLPKRNACVFDIGAHGGVYTIAIMKNCKDSTVYSFEPLPNDLLNNLTLNELPTDKVFPVAVGKQKGTANITVTNRSANYLTQDAEKNSKEVRVISLDEEWKANRIPSPHAIKIDIEGMEFPALQGGKEMLSQSKPLIVCEINSLYERYYQKLEDFLNFMSELGYSLYRYMDNKMIPIQHKTIENLDAYKLGESVDRNYWFLHKTHEHHLKSIN